jgi:hypothetical protein
MKIATDTFANAAPIATAVRGTGGVPFEASMTGQGRAAPWRAESTWIKTIGVGGSRRTSPGVPASEAAARQSEVARVRLSSSECLARRNPARPTGGHHPSPIGHAIGHQPTTLPSHIPHLTSHMG